jgi:osmoprotectant transport system substrate-binding protein
MSVTITATRRIRFLVMVLAFTLCASCGSSETASAAAQGAEPETLRIASFDFAESELLAELFAQIAESIDVPVTRLGAVGPREIVSPALETGAIDLVPEYLGTALRFAGHDEALADAGAAADQLGDLLGGRGLIVLDPASASDVNVFAVSAATAASLGLEKLSDLQGAGLARFGGPPECPDRPLCLVGLAERYGVNFEEFVPQTSLPFTAESLRRGEIDIGLFFSTSPELDDEQFRVLRDDLELQPPENLIPVIREDALDRWGDELADRVNEVMMQLTTDELRQLNRMVADGQQRADVVADWLQRNDPAQAES